MKYRARQSSGHPWQCLLFYPQDLHLQQSLLWEWACALDWLLTRGWFNHSISSSKVAAIARAFWWASLTSVRLLPVAASLLSLLGVLLLGGLTSVGLHSPAACGTSPLSHPWQSSREATTSSTSSGSLGGDPGSLWSLYTLWYRNSICFLLVWGPTSWMAGTSASGSSFSRPWQQPQQTICSASLCPCCKACRYILCNTMRQWGLSTSHLSCPSRNSSISIIHSVSWMDRPSLIACPLAARALSFLLLYFNVSNLWYLKKMRGYSST